jgi:PST family polysaccharide transporter
MEFSRIALANIISSVLAVIVSIIMAWAGFGYWSLVFLTLSQSIFSTLLLWYYCPWRPKLIFWQKGIKSFLHFGAGISGFNIINYFSRNMDNIVIGRFLGATILGFYSKAYQLMMLPLTKLRDPLVTVGIPALSSLINQPDRFRNYYHRLIFIICFFSFPMTIFLGLFAKQLIVVVLGHQWMQSVVIFKLLSLSALIQPIGGTMGLIFISAGQPARFFKLGLVTSSTIIISFFIGIQWGVTGLIIAYTLANYMLLIPSLLYCFKGTPIKFIPVFKEILLPGIHALLLGGILYMIKYVFSQYLSDFLLLTVSFLIAVPFYYYTWIIYKKGRVKVQDINELIKICLLKLKSIFSFVF